MTKDDDTPTSPPIALKPWSIARSHYPLRDRWLTVRADDCVTAEGVSIAPYYVLEYADWVEVVALDRDDNILLIKQYRHALGRVCLELPGGGMDAGETDPIAAARRELREETGFSASDWQHVASLSPNPATHTNLCPIVLARDIEAAFIPADDPSERIELVRMPIAEAIRAALAGEMMQVIHVSALTLALHRAGKWQIPGVNAAG